MLIFTFMFVNVFRTKTSVAGHGDGSEAATRLSERFTIEMPQNPPRPSATPPVEGNQKNIP